MNEHNTIETTVFQPALFPLSAVQTSGYATPDVEPDIAADADDEASQPVGDAA